MLRILGILLLMAALGYLCLLHSRRETARVKQCEGLMLLVRHLRTRIGSFREPPDIALAAFQSEALEEMGFLPVARERGLASAVRAFYGAPPLPQEEWGMLATFAERLGASYTREALALCESTERALSQTLTRCREDAPARRRVGHALLIFGGLSLFLLFG